MQDKKLLEEYKAEINDLKALKMPSSEFEKADEYNQSEEQEERFKKQIRALEEQVKEKEEDQRLEQEQSKKWYQFWK